MGCLQWKRPGITGPCGNWRASEPINGKRDASPGPSALTVLQSASAVLYPLPVFVGSCGVRLAGAEIYSLYFKNANRSSSSLRIALTFRSQLPISPSSQLIL